MSVSLTIGKVSVPDLKKVTEAAIEDVPAALGESAVRLVQEQWPIDTGRSKAGFYIELNGNTAVLMNREDYAAYRNKLPLKKRRRPRKAGAKKRRGGRGIAQRIIGRNGSREPDFLAAGLAAVKGR